MRVREVRFQIRSVDVFQYGDVRQIHNGQRKVVSGMGMESDPLYKPGDKYAYNFVT